MSPLKYLAEQGLEIRRNNDCEGNFKRLLHLRAEDDEYLKMRLSSRKVTFTSGDNQNKILEAMIHDILINICSEVNEMSGQYGIIIIDGT